MTGRKPPLVGLDRATRVFDRAAFVAELGRLLDKGLRLTGPGPGHENFAVFLRRPGAEPDFILIGEAETHLSNHLRLFRDRFLGEMRDSFIEIHRQIRQGAPVLDHHACDLHLLVQTPPDGRARIRLAIQGMAIVPHGGVRPATLGSRLELAMARIDRIEGALHPFRVEGVELRAPDAEAAVLVWAALARPDLLDFRKRGPDEPSMILEVRDLEEECIILVPVLR